MNKTLWILLLLFGTSSTYTFGMTATVNVTAVAHQYVTEKNIRLDTNAQHDIEIINDSNRDETFSYTYAYCGDTIQKCVKVSSTAIVRAHKRWNNHYNSYVSNTYDHKGSYNLVATTSISGRINKAYTGYGSVLVR
jgi:hypothetical protein